ncbi:OLC1v1008864C1 [Oldenlandia corymbosa var. corymbosa]|uniref:OLC1v1008864C1 n=1 Tax=Oldenlandia corymbosa var. corymbosa TaxID=529605 RepID=A0AAV1DQE2_OLDCO|nr:OLC1v1008864C1 [Oldenlandia corymbosa var. corymbosa]
MARRTSRYDLPMAGSTTVNDTTHCIIPAHTDGRLHELNQELIKLEKQLEEENKLAEALEKAEKEESRKDQWWRKPIEELDMEQLMTFAKMLEGLKKDIRKEINSRSMDLNNVNSRTFSNAAENVNPFGGN